MTNAKLPIKVFISYAHEDKGIVGLIANTLKEHAIELVSSRFLLTSIGWGTESSLPLHVGHDDGAFEKAFRRADVYIVLVSKASMESSDVHFEVGAALARVRLMKDAAIIPVILEDVDQGKIPGRLSENAIDATTMALSTLQARIIDRIVT